MVSPNETPKRNPFVVSPLPAVKEASRGCMPALLRNVVALAIVVAGAWFLYGKVYNQPVAQIQQAIVVPAGDVLHISARLGGTSITLAYRVTADSDGYILLDADGDTIRCNVLPQSVAGLELCEVLGGG